MSAAMLPPAPGLFSTTTDWLQISCRRLPTRRAVMSVDPPGVNGTTIFTGLAGQLSASAREGRITGDASAAVARPRKRRRVGMNVPPASLSPDCLGSYDQAKSEEAGSANQCDDWLERRLLLILLVVLGAGNDIGAGKPPVEIDVAATRGTEWPRRVIGRLAADRTTADLALAVVGFLGRGGLLRRGRHSASRSEPENPHHRAGSPIHKAAAPPHCCRSRPS